MKWYDSFILEYDNNFTTEYLKLHKITETIIDNNIVHFESKSILTSSDGVCFIHSSKKNEHVITLITLGRRMYKELVDDDTIYAIKNEYKFNKCLPILDHDLRHNYYELSFINKKRYNIERVYTKDIFIVNNRLVASIFNSDEFIPLDHLVAGFAPEQLKKFVFNFPELKTKLKIQELYDDDYIIEIESKYFNNINIENIRPIGTKIVKNINFDVLLISGLIPVLNELRAMVIEYKQ